MTEKVVNDITRTLTDLERRSDIRAIIITHSKPGVFITHYSLDEIQQAAKPSRLLRRLLGRCFIPAVQTTMSLARLLIRLDNTPIFGRVIAYLTQGTPLEGALIYARANHLIQRIRNSPKPIIAAMDGDAQGYGMELAMACDFRLMTRGNHHMGQIETLVGLIPGSGGLHHLVRVAGTAKALEWSLSGTRFNADQAESVGLIYKAVDPDQLMNESIKLATSLSHKSPLTIQHIKHCIHHGHTLPFGRALKKDEARFMDTACSEPAQNAHKQQREALDVGVSSCCFLDQQEQRDIN